ncbi:MAG: Na+/H+ antiporter NhaC family protein [Bacteroidales bacterium]
MTGNTEQKPKPSALALLPLLVFLASYLVVSLLLGDFYKMPITVAFLLSAIVSVMITRDKTLAERVEHFSIGAANKNIMLMIWIFILAGAFAQTAKAMGAVDATVNLAVSLLPDYLLIGGIFLAACFISLSIGTSVGTIVALTPVAVGIAAKTGVGLPFMTAVVVGGALFGDNLSFISDTTIAATKTQGCEMKDKFKVNSMIVAPVALIVFIIYLFVGRTITQVPESAPIELWKVVPYLFVLISALAGMNVIRLLVLGTIFSGIIGLLLGSFDPLTWMNSMGEGIMGMSELIIITLMAGGMLEMIRYNGGIEFIINLLTKGIRSKRGAEFSIAGLVSFANLCTANNTIAIITAGPIAKDIANRFDIDPRKSASLLDTFSCFIQGIIPYGAQLLIAAGLAGISPISIIPHLYYPFLMGIAAILAIVFRYPRRYTK